MDPTQALLFGVALPAAVAGVALLVAGVTRLRFLAAAAVALAFAAAFVEIVGRPSFPPKESTHWLPWVAAAAVAAALLEPSPLLGKAVRAIACVAVPVVFLSRLPGSWTEPTRVVWAAALVGGTAVVWLSLDGLARAAAPSAMLAATWIVAAASAVAIGLSGSAVLGQLAGAVAAALGAALVLCVWKPASAVAPGVVPAVALLLPALWICGRFFAELPLSAMACLAAS
ncbi:MAG TPA: hypothetical protein VKE69_09615, partial [Planctomycetota bacterium]|nr:hypothetical protein [Planctomycetota bacterium]